MKHTIAALSCTAALVASLTACGSEDDKPTLPVYTGTSSTGTSSPSTTAASQPTTTPPTASRTGSAASAGPAALVSHATYTYGGLKVTVNLPADIPSASRPSVRLFSDFLQAAGRTVADNKADPRLRRLAAPQVARYLTDAMDPKAGHSVGTLIFTVTKITPAGSHFVAISGCMDQSKAFPTDKAGKRIAHSSDNPIVKISGSVTGSGRGITVGRFAFHRGVCS